jgi:hypothetical protein
VFLFKAYLGCFAGVPKPSAATLDAIINDEELLAGFDDPEVLAAVNDIANNPAKGRMYAKNKKVRPLQS